MQNNFNMPPQLSFKILSNIPLDSYYVVQIGAAYVAIDNGGNPYKEAFAHAKKYATLNEAVQSMKNNSGTQILHCKTFCEVVQQSEVDHQLRLSAIAKLTPEEIRALGLNL